MGKQRKIKEKRRRRETKSRGRFYSNRANENAPASAEGTPPFFSFAEKYSLLNFDKKK